MRACAVILVLLGAGLIGGRAQAQMVPPRLTADAVLGPCAPSADLARKRPGKAFLCSLAFTAVPVGAGLLVVHVFESPPPVFIGSTLYVAGVLAGPAAGHLYAGDLRRARQGLAWRVAGGGVVMAASVVIFTEVFTDLLTLSPARYWRGWDVLLGVGFGVIAVSALWDLATAPLSATRYNRGLKADVRLRPMIDPVRRNAGLSLAVRF